LKVALRVFIGVILIFVFSIFLISLGRQDALAEKVVTNHADAPQVPDPIAQTDVADSVGREPQKAYPPAYGIGDPLSVGYWSFICNSAFWTPVLAFDPYSMERANGDFVVINITARNDDTSSSTVPPFQLMDTDGRTYDASSAGMLTRGFFSFLEELNPGVSKRGNIAFDVPRDRQYFLIASGGFQSSKRAIVILPMSVPRSEQEVPPVPEASY